MHSSWKAGWAVAVVLAVSAGGVTAAEGDVGVIKSAKGTVVIARDKERIQATVGAAVRQADRVLTGKDGSAGITFTDSTLISLGPSSNFVVDRYRYDSATQTGSFESTLKKGKIAVISGRIAKGALDAMKVSTPDSIMGVRGTEFVVEAR